MSMKSVQEVLLDNLKKWQKIEGASIASTAKIAADTDNPLIRMVMSIIQRDSQTHQAVQEYLVSTLEQQAPTLNPDELVKVWDAIEKHIEIEKQMIELVRDALAVIGDKGMVIQQYFLRYLLEDEQKHEMLLEALEKIKKGMYPYG